MKGVEIRLAREEDIPQIVPLWKELIGLHYFRDSSFEIDKDAPQRFEEFLQTSLKKADTFILVAESLSEEKHHQLEINTPRGLEISKTNKIIGYCTGYIKSRLPVFKIKATGYIWDIYVGVEYRQKSIGRELFNAAKSWFEGHGMKRIELSMAMINDVSDQFWKHLGFRPFMKEVYLDLV
jgi:ribosomal protein S18 acetylase RimI-like enzyme